MVIRQKRTLRHVTITQERAASRIPLAAIRGRHQRLLFAMEPFVAKVLLPRLGGTPRWNTCAAFQMPSSRHGYSVLSSARPTSGSVAIHAALVAVSIALWPFAVRALRLTPRPGCRPVAVTAAVIAAIGLPFA